MGCWHLACSSHHCTTLLLVRLQGPYYLNTAPADCNDATTRVAADGVTRTTGRVRVFRWGLLLVSVSRTRQGTSSAR